MRNKIDNLLLFNLTWTLVILLDLWLYSFNLFLFCFAGTALTFLYEINLIRKLDDHVEQSARGRLRKRIIVNAGESLTLAVITISFLLQLSE